MADVFISYKRERFEVAKKLAATLTEIGWTVWWDTDLKAGEGFREEIERELSAARCVVVIWCDQAVHSHFVRDEAARALRANALIPMLWSDVDQPIGFGEVQAIRMLGWSGEPCYEIERLTEAIRSKIGEPGHLSASPLGSPGAIPTVSSFAQRMVDDPFGSAIERMRRVVAGASPDDRLRSGFADFDHMLDGLPKGSLTVLAARPGMGAMAFVCGMMRNWLRASSSHSSLPRIGILCRQRSPDDWAIRLIAAIAEVDINRVRRGKLSHAEIGLIEEAGAILRTAGIQFADASGVPLDQTSQIAESLRSRAPLDVVFVDLADDDVKVREAAGRIALDLKNLAAAHRMACVALLPLPRHSSDERTNMWEDATGARPTLDDLGKMKWPEATCDMVLFLHRDAYYLERYEPPEGTDEHIVWMRALDEVYPHGEVLVARNRYGPVGAVRMNYNHTLAVFDDLRMRPRPVSDE